MKTLVLTERAFNKIKEFEPKYYSILVQFLWYDFNILGKKYSSYTKFAYSEADKNLSVRTTTTLEIDKSDFILDDVEEPKPTEITINKAYKLASFLKNCEYAYAIFAVLGFILGTLFTAIIL